MNPSGYEGLKWKQITAWDILELICLRKATAKRINANFLLPRQKKLRLCNFQPYSYVFLPTLTHSREATDLETFLTCWN